MVCTHAAWRAEPVQLLWSWGLPLRNQSLLLKDRPAQSRQTDKHMNLKSAQNGCGKTPVTDQLAPFELRELVRQCCGCRWASCRRKKGFGFLRLCRAQGVIVLLAYDEYLDRQECAFGFLSSGMAGRVGPLGEEHQQGHPQQRESFAWNRYHCKAPRRESAAKQSSRARAVSKRASQGSCGSVRRSASTDRHRLQLVESDA